MTTCLMNPNRIADAYNEAVKTLKALCRDYKAEAELEREARRIDIVHAERDLGTAKQKRDAWGHRTIRLKLAKLHLPTFHDDALATIQLFSSKADAYGVVLAPVEVDFSVAEFVALVESGKYAVIRSKAFKETYSHANQCL